MGSLGITDLRWRHIGELSGGQQQRTLLAMRHLARLGFVETRPQGVRPTGR